VPSGALLVRSSVLLGLFQLHLEPLRANLETVHGLNSALSGSGVVVGDEAEALAEVGHFIDEHFGAQNRTKRGKHLVEVRVRDFVGQVVDEQVAAVGTWRHMHTQTYSMTMQHKMCTHVEYTNMCSQAHTNTHVKCKITETPVGYAHT